MNTKIIKVITIASTISLLSTNMVFGANLVVATGNNINVRTSTSLNSSVVDKIQSGRVIQIAQNMSGDFYNTNYNGQNVYIHSDYFDVIEADANPAFDGVQIKATPSFDAETIHTLSVEDVVTVTEQVNGWYKVKFENVEGYVPNSNLVGRYIREIKSTQEAEKESVISYAIVQKEGTKMYANKDENSNVEAELNVDEVVFVIEQNDEWSRVKNENHSGYVKTDALLIRTPKEIEEKVVVEKTTTTSTSTGSSKGQEMVEYGKKYLGTTYSWAGTNLSKGVDCSGFVYAVYRDFGITLNRSSKDMVANGRQISKGDLQAGDLVFFDTSGANNGAISHVGIYMGDSKFIHSSSSGKSYGVTISSLNEDYYLRTYVTACTVLNK